MTILKSTQTRIFLIEGRADPEFEPSYESQFKVLEPSQDLGARTAKKVPDPSRPGKFVEISTTAGVSGRVTTTLEGYYARDLLSKLLELSEIGCSYDIQIHAGECLNPQVFNSFDKNVIFEVVDNENWSAGQLTALGSEERAAVTETVQISARNIYEALPLSWGKKASSLIEANEIKELVDAVYCDNVACSACSKGFALALSEDAWGVQWNQSTDSWTILDNSNLETYIGIEWNRDTDTWSSAELDETEVNYTYILYTENGWGAVYAHGIGGLVAVEDYHTGIDCVDDYVVIVSNISGSIHYALLTDFENGGAPSFTEISTGIVGSPNDIYSLGRKAFVVGDSGYVYSTTDPTAGLTVEDAGIATAENLNRVHAISEQFAVAVGNNGAVVWTEDGDTWTSADISISSNLISVFVKSQYEWWAGSDAGILYYSKDQGSTWRVKTFPGYNDGNVYDIVFATDSIVYLAHTTSGDVGRILRSFDGGYTWIVLPQGAGAMPANDRINRLGICSDAPLQTAANHIVGVGLNGSDGILVHGQASKQPETLKGDAA